MLKSQAPTHQRTFAKFLEVCENFGDPHRHFLQFMMAVRSVKVSRVADLFHQICVEIEDCNSDRLKELQGLDNPHLNSQVMERLMNTLNPKLGAVGLRLVHVFDEYSRRMDFLALIAELHFSESLSLAGPLSKEELAMFNHWLRLMFKEHQLQEDQLDASASASLLSQYSFRAEMNNVSVGGGGGEIDLVKALTFAKSNGWTMQRAEHLIEKIAKQGWIKKRGGVVRLHVTAIAELEPLLNSLNVPQCSICKHPVVVTRLSYKCAECSAAYHANCMLRELEFPCTCSGEDCNAELTEELIEEFNFDGDTERVLPRRKTSIINRSLRPSERPGTSSNSNTNSSVKRPRFELLRDI